MPVLWSFRSVLIASNSEQRRLASEMLQYVAWRKASGRWARLRPNDVTDSFNLLPFIWSVVVLNERAYLRATEGEP